MADAHMNGPRQTNDADRSRASSRRVAGYEIRIKDHLETHWISWFEGWRVTNLENGEVLLTSLGMDQSRLHGALNKIRDLNLLLLEVRHIPIDDEADRPPMDRAGEARPRPG